MSGRRAGRVLVGSLVAVMAGLAPVMAVYSGVYAFTAYMLFVAVMAVIMFIDRLCRIRARLVGGRLVVEMGVCGRVEIGLGSVRGAALVNRVEPEWRVFGVCIPGLYYTGVFELRGYGRALLLADRLENLLRLELDNGTRILVGGNADGLAELVAGQAGRGPKGITFRVRPSPWLAVGATTVLPFVAYALTTRVAAGNPGPEAWIVFAVIWVIAFAFSLLTVYAARRDPATAFILTLSTLSMGFLAVSLLLELVLGS